MAVADGEGYQRLQYPVDWGHAGARRPCHDWCRRRCLSGEIADDMLMVPPSASSLDVTKDKTTVFPVVAFTDPTMGASTAKFLAEKYADAKISPVLQPGDTYSSGVADAFAEQAKESNDIVDTETFKDDSSTRFYQPASPRPRRPAPRSSLRRSTTRRRPFCSKNRQGRWDTT